MKDKISKIILFDGKAIVTAVTAVNAADKAVKIHKMTDGAGEVLAHALAVGGYFAAGLKGYEHKFSFTLSGGGKVGKIVVAGGANGKIRGYVEVPNAMLEYREGAYDIADGVGGDGFLQVIKDFSTGKPYGGNTRLVKGDIASDFAYYFASSEQLPTAIAVGAEVKNGECKCCGAIFLQTMPNADENVRIMLEDTAANFSNLRKTLGEKSMDEILDFYFSHLNAVKLEDSPLTYECVCSKEKIDGTLLGLGRAECDKILLERGEIEVHCEFCNTYYKYKDKDIINLFGGQ